MVYLDNAATTKPCDESCAAVMQGLECFGNPSSLHRVGLDAEILITRARETVSQSLGCLAEEIYFTSGATESNNTAIFGAFKTQGKRKKRVVTTTVEHPSVARPVDELEKLGMEVVRVCPDENGAVSAADIFRAVNEDTCLVSCMLVNNETGAILPVEKAFSMIKKKYPDVITHCDCVQGYMKLPVKVKKLCADMISVSGHKICAPKGVGALYVRKGLHIPPFLLGGGQERGFRSGTESVALICGFAAAVKRLMDSVTQNLAKMRELESYLAKRCGENSGISLNYIGEKSPYVNSISVSGLKSEVLLHFLESREVYVSSGSACSKGKKSSVLKEFRISELALDTTIRVSFCAESSSADVDALVLAIEQAQKSLQRLK